MLVFVVVIVVGIVVVVIVIVVVVVVVVIVVASVDDGLGPRVQVDEDHDAQEDDPQDRQGHREYLVLKKHCHGIIEFVNPNKEKGSAFFRLS
jgi:hypothetical protein